jgi:hypothetical protein
MTLEEEKEVVIDAMKVIVEKVELVKTFHDKIEEWVEQDNDFRKKFEELEKRANEAINQ